MKSSSIKKNIIGKNSIIGKTRIIVFFILFFLPAPGCAVAENISVEYKPGTSLRKLAEQHLGHPDRWEMVLRYNGFSRLSDLPAGTSLVIPVSEYRQLDEKLKTIRTLCSQAALNGAKILSPRSLKQAWDKERNIRSLMNRGDLTQAVKIAKEAVLSAQKALDDALKKRIHSVSAILHHKQGSVQNRRQDRRVWKEAEIGQEFVEKEYIRTLSASRGGIYFINDQYIDLTENALVVIGEIRKDLIEKTAVANVKVLKGDVLVFLESLNHKETFSLELPGVKTKIRSKRFRTGRDRRKTARIANYDGEIDVEAAGEAVTLHKNEGTRIVAMQAPTPPVSLLPPPRFIRPEAEHPQAATRFSIEWEAVEKAGSYRVEISDTLAFSSILYTGKSSSCAMTWNAPANGVYYIRILSIDADGLAGPFSDPLVVYVNTDVSELFLSVHAPDDGMVFFSDQATLRGVTMAGASLSVNQIRVPVAVDGGFFYNIPLKDGVNEISIEARKPGKRPATIVRRVTYRSDETLLKLDEEGTIFSRQNTVMLNGTVAARALVEINGRPVQLTGRFTHLLDLPEGDHLIRIKAHQPPNRVQEIDVPVHIDLTPPKLMLNSVPSYVKNERVTLTGRVSADASLFMDNSAVPVSEEGDFTVSVPLAEGRNDIRFRANDSAGNRTQVTRTLWQDIRPPVIEQIEVSPARVKSGGIIMVSIRARDDGGGLAKTGQFTLEIGETRLKGILSLDKDGKHYQGSVFAPTTVAGAVKISRLMLRDLLGNRTTAAYDAATGKWSETADP